MSKINKNSITKKTIWGLQILAILALGFMAAPENSYARSYVDGPNSYEYVPPAHIPSTRITEARENPEPVIKSITPSESNRGVGTKTITITGNGFIPSSIAKINGTPRFTTFIDRSHLAVQTNATDMSQNGGFYITVYNGAPGGGYSNAIYFTLKSASTASPSRNGNYGGNSNAVPQPEPDTFMETVQTENEGLNGQSLASSVILGGNTFLPSGLVQWIIVAILILAIIIVARKVFGAREQYDSTPLKHA